MIASTLRISLARWAPIPLRLIVGYGFMEVARSSDRRGMNAICSISRASRRWF
jgi:hypothetical protein